MAASDHLHPAQFVNEMPFYHGTGRYLVGDRIKPGQPNAGWTPHPGGDEAYYSGRYAYASTDGHEAFMHAAGENRGHVVRVSPIGIPRRDPEDENELHPTLFMSTQGWRIEKGDAETRRYNEILRD